MEGIHKWQSESGRGCQKQANEKCSQTVYTCSICGVYDYGDKGGLAWKECFLHCSEYDESNIT